MNMLSQNCYSGEFVVNSLLATHKFLNLCACVTLYELSLLHILVNWRNPDLWKRGVCPVWLSVMCELYIKGVGAGSGENLMNGDMAVCICVISSLHNAANVSVMMGEDLV